MYLYQKTLIKHIYLTIFVITGIITSIICITQLLGLLYLFDKGVNANDFMWIIALLTPSLLYIILPITTTLSVAYLLYSYENQRQLIILRIIGLSNSTIAKPIAFSALLLTCFTYFLSIYLMPWSQIEFRSRLHNLKENYISNILRENSFNQLSKNINIYIGQKLSEGQFENLIIFDTRRSENSIIHFAKYGTLQKFDGQSVMIINQGHSQFYDENHRLMNLEFDALMVEMNYGNKSSHTKRILAEFYINELLRQPTTSHASNVDKMRVEGHERLLWPLYTYLLPIATFGLLLKLSLRKRTAYMLAGGFVLLIMYFHFFTQTYAIYNIKYLYLIYINPLILWLVGRLFYYENNQI